MISQEVVEIVSHAACQLTDHLHLLRLPELFLAAVQGFPRLLQRTNVLESDHGSDDFPLVLDGGAGIANGKGIPSPCAEQPASTWRT